MCGAAGVVETDPEKVGSTRTALMWALHAVSAHPDAPGGSGTISLELFEEGDGSECPCCAAEGVLPHLPGFVGMVPREVVVKMCDACIGAAFLGDGVHPHAFDAVRAARS